MSSECNAQLTVVKMFVCTVISLLNTYLITASVQTQCNGLKQTNGYE